MNSEDFDIWWNTVWHEVYRATHVELLDSDQESFKPDWLAGKCAYEVARAYVEDIENGETL
jgi:hypothetical protein